MGLGRKLYRGETEFPLVARRKTFYAISVVLVLIALGSMVFRGFNLGTEFKGGSTFQWPSKGISVADTRSFFEGQLKIVEPTVQTVGRGSGVSLRVQTKTLPDAKITEVTSAIAAKYKIKFDDVATSSVGPAWGQQITDKAIKSLIIFLILVSLYISFRFERKMALAAMVALVHDLLLAVGIYSLTQFVITPSTVIALLTVLGYSLYDTIVVFDKVEENTKGLTASARSTYGEAAELAVNQTFMRSINTSLIALLPVAGLLFVGAFLLGAGTLKDLALALFVGLASGAYSSLFLATPILVDLKEREPENKALTQRVLQRRSGTVPTSRFAQRAAARAAGEPLPAGVALTADGQEPADAAPAAAVARGASGHKPVGGSASRNNKTRKGGRGGGPGGSKKRR